jgi:hypothetical protein
VRTDLASVGRLAGWLVAAGLTVAAAAAIVILLSGDFGVTDGRVILTSLGFALASATGSAGARALSRDSAALRSLGAATVACSLAAFGLVVVGIWTFDWFDWLHGDADLWRAYGCIAIAGIAGAHACLMLGARRAADAEAVRLLTTAAVCLGAFDALGAILPLSRLVEDVGETWAKVFGSAFVLFMLTSVLPPLLRALERSRAAAQRPESGPEFASGRV